MVPGFEWDPVKRLANLEKHGVDFVGATRIFLSLVLETPDQRRAYGEPRIIAVGSHSSEVLTVVYTWRGATRRIISARRSNRREKETYDAARADAARPYRLGPPPPNDG